MKTETEHLNKLSDFDIYSITIFAETASEKFFLITLEINWGFLPDDAVSSLRISGEPIKNYVCQTELQKDFWDSWEYSKPSKELRITCSPKVIPITFSQIQKKKSQGAEG